MSLKPISEAPHDGRPILAYFDDKRPQEHRYVVVFFDESAYLWRTRHGQDFIGLPTHFNPDAF